MTTVLWCCWLGGRKGIRPVTEWLGAGVVICLERGADLHMAQLMPLPLAVLCFSKIQIGFTFLVLGSTGQKPLNGCLLFVVKFYDTLVHLAGLLCRDPEGILACCTHIPPLVQQNLVELHAIVRDARERPIEKVDCFFSTTVWIHPVK